MGTTASTPAPASSAKHGSTLNGMAASSFCLACWGNLTFWWYPFGLMVAVVALVLGVISLAMGIRGRNSENLALPGVILALNGIFMAAVVYRGVQFFFEGTSPMLP